MLFFSGTVTPKTVSWSDRDSHAAVFFVLNLINYQKSKRLSTLFAITNDLKSAFYAVLNSMQPKYSNDHF
jgi:hypothetical protein